MDTSFQDAIVKLYGEQKFHKIKKVDMYLVVLLNMNDHVIPGKLE